MNTESPGLLRVLIVDDNELDRAEAKAALLIGSNRLYEFIEASTAEEGLRLCWQLPFPDCIVLDLGLPDANDLDVLNRLPRDEYNLLQVPVVVLTGYITHGLNQAALRAGAHDYVGKAWLGPETLTQAVENAIERLDMMRTMKAQLRAAEVSRIRALQLEGENRQIQEANRLKSQFLANMSHELRTPLTAIIGFADLLNAGAVPTDSPEHHVFLGHIGTSGRHLLQLINDVLDLSKVESGKLEFFPETLNLSLLVKEVRDILHTQIQRKHLAIATEIEAGLGDIVLDSARLKQVLYNYLSNAIKFTADGGRVTVRARAQGARHFRLEVEDSGVGIAEADLPRLFTDYQQLDSGNARQYQGTGLGLALTRRLVQAQHGSVGVRSERGVGSVFHVVLNRVHGTDASCSTENTDRLTTFVGDRLLVIQDERNGVSPFAGALEEAGFRVDSAATGDLAVQRAGVEAYDAITLDLLLPDQCGLSALERIRRQGLSRHSPVVGIALTSKSGAAASFPIADVLCKPIRSGEIAAAMARLGLPGTSPIKVMVIDDDPQALNVMRATLQAVGIDAACLLDGRQALRELDQHRPDAIVLDLMMPEFDGFDVLDALQGLPDWCDTPVFIWTSMLLTDAEYARLKLSAQTIVSKGGGSMNMTLDALRRWRLPVTLQAAGSVQ